MEHAFRMWGSLFVFKNVSSSPHYICTLLAVGFSTLFLSSHSYELSPLLLYTVPYCQYLKITDDKICPDRRNISDINWLNTLSAVHDSSFPKLYKNFHERTVLVTLLHLNFPPFYNFLVLLLHFDIFKVFWYHSEMQSSVFKIKSSFEKWWKIWVHMVLFLSFL